MNRDLPLNAEQARRRGAPGPVLQPVGRQGLFWLQVASWQRQLPNLTVAFSTRPTGQDSAEGAATHSVTRRRPALGQRQNDLAPFVAAVVPPGGRVFAAEQVHGRDIAIVPSPTADVASRHGQINCLGAADGLATDQAGNFLMIVTADCVPLLLVGPETGALAAVHAGWRGTAAGIAAAAVKLLGERYGQSPAGIKAVMGPSIGSCCYEIDGPVIAAMHDKLPRPDEVLSYKPAGKAQLDLRAANSQLLQQAGVPSGQILTSSMCTACQPDLFYSYRREGGNTGRLAMVAGWTSR